MNAEIDSKQVSQAFQEYKWYNSSSLVLEVKCSICRLEFSTNMRVGTIDVPSDIYFTGHIICNQNPMLEIPISTQFSQSDETRNCLTWDYILSFPIKIRDLSLDSLLVLTAWTADSTLYGGTSMHFYDNIGSLKMGKQKLMFFFGTRGDANSMPGSNITPGHYYDYYEKWDYRFLAEKQIDNSKEKGPVNNRESKFEWLDRVTLTQLERQMNNYHTLVSNTRDNISQLPNLSEENPLLQESENWGYSLNEFDLHTFCFLIVEIPILPHKVLYEDKQYQTKRAHAPPLSQTEVLGPYMIDDRDENVIEFSLTGRPFNASALTFVIDWDMDEDNLCEDMHRRLNHNTRRGTGDATVKPNLLEKEKIDRIINSVVHHNMSVEEADLIYIFRYSLTENKKALVKFICAVNWDEESEVAEVPVLLALWREKANPPIAVADALKFLSREKSFENAIVREWAVNVLRSATNEELLTFLLQLVQALRYETASSSSGAMGSSGKSLLPTADLLAAASQTAAATTTTTAALTPTSKSATTIAVASSSALSVLSPAAASATPAFQRAATGGTVGLLAPLAAFLVDRACSSPIVANFFYWYLKVEMEDDQFGYIFQNVFEVFIVQLSHTGPEGRLLFQRLGALDQYISQISGCQREARTMGKYREAKQESLRKLLEERGLQNLQIIDWVPMPLKPSIRLTGLIPQTAKMFASAIYPCVIDFYEYMDPQPLANSNSDVARQQGAAGNTAAVTVTVPINKQPNIHKIMFKSGDDLRQDQLIVQMIALMDSLLKKVGLDLKILTYGILAVGQKDGIMEFVDNSMPISAILKKFYTITEFLRQYNPDKSGPYEIAPIALDNFVKSCAGYCVITYILGIGDRHLDNIMITTSGQMFHIDFGFIFGQDPKPMPPPFRFNRPMADAMGGEDSEYFARFKTFCCQSYNWLRKSASLILNLLSLMGDAGIQDISKKSTLSNVLMNVEEKFRLDLTDEQAEQFFIGLINESLHAIAPRLLEVAHQIAVSMR